MHKSRYAVYASIILAACVLAGCAGPRSPQPAAPPPIAVPPENHAVIYVFRPAADKTGFQASPSLSVGGLPVARLPWSSYTHFVVPAGEYILELKPSGADDKAWSARTRLCARAGYVHFAAVWNQAQPGRSMGTIAVPIAGAFVPLPLSGPSSSGSVVFENVAADLGGEALAGLSESKAADLTAAAQASHECRPAPGN